MHVAQRLLANAATRWSGMDNLNDYYDVNV
jgi:hypothetical protein